MTEQTSNTGAAPVHKPNFVEKIVDKLKHHGHGHGQDQHQQPATTNASQKVPHTYGGPDNEHDNAYVAEASVVGAHAIPPMTFHADTHRSDHVSSGASNAQTQPPAVAQAQQTSASTGAHGHSPNEPFREFGDRVAGHDLHSAENERQRPVM
ncbi:hypothetical protein BGZ75_001149 [Mortierella antarctica]|nr:hypothetical protein BGZ67_005073 [Mortierella alpina]KAF9987013.1 hypothetical protein BGZ75_001149 [Mortierella antarctica]